MLKRIVHPSTFLVTFVTLLHLNLSKPQGKHLLRTADAIIVCEGRKTLANLYRQWVEAPDASARSCSMRALILLSHLSNACSISPEVVLGCSRHSFIPTSTSSVNSCH